MSMMDKFNCEYHFLWCFLDQGHVDPLLYALLMHSEFEYLPLMNIDSPFNEGQKFY